MPILSCEVCGQPAHGNHFGVVSCRACAAFFRRATLNPSKKLNLICVHGDKLEVHANGYFSCKKCRLKKCIEKGMDDSRFQHDRDLISTAVVTVRKPVVIPQTLATFLGRPSFLISCDPLESSPGPIKEVLNCNFLIDKAIEILKNGNYKPYNPEMNSLEKIAMEFERMKIGTSSELKYLSYMGRSETLFVWEEEFMNTAEWLSNFSEFNKLPIEVQIEVVKSIWQTYGRFEKLARTAEFRRTKLFKSNNLFVVADEACIDSEETDVDVTWFTNYTKEQVAYFMDCFHNEIFREIIEELIDLNPTTTELNYMLLLLCLQSSAKKLQGDVAIFADHLQEILSNQLHQYYTDVRKMPNYSGRLVRMMKVNNLMHKDIWRQKEKKQLAYTFDVFSLAFSHPEMMC